MTELALGRDKGWETERQREVKTRVGRELDRERLTESEGERERKRRER